MRDEPPAESPRATPVAVTVDQLEGFRWPDLFGNDHPVELEIGTGKAGFLLRRAQAVPDRNFLGIEWCNQIYKYAVDRMQRWQVPNVRMLRTDADHFVRVLCPVESLQVLHVYHPDPWPKKRHHKRRLVKQPFIEAAIDRIVPGGYWRLQTDHADYFRQMTALLAEHPRLRQVEFEDESFGYTPEGIATNFEIKYIREGRPIYRLALQRVT